MPALCGSLGPMMCLNGATCNELTGACENCPSGFSNDETLFLGNQNCGIANAGLYFVYIFTVVAAIAMSCAAAMAAARKKKSKMRLVLILVAIWNAMIPFYLLAHWLEGHRHGLAATVMYITVLLTVNTQVALMNSAVENFMALTCNYANPARLQKAIWIWNAIWLVCKVVFGITMIVGVTTNNDDTFNAGQIALICSLIIEVSLNILRTYGTDRKIIRGVRSLHTDIKASNVNPIVEEFAHRVEKNKYIFPVYGVFAFGIAIAVPALFVVYKSSIPYAIVIWSFFIMTWPVVGMAPVLLLRTRLGAQMDKTASKTAAGDSTLIQPGKSVFVDDTKDDHVPDYAQSPVSSATQKTANNITMDAESTVVSTMVISGPSS